MLTFFSPVHHRDCEGLGRRDFLQLGVLGGSGFTLAQLLAARSAAADSGQKTKSTAVVWVWLGGGPTHIETFDPKLTAPSEYRSLSGEVSTNIPGVTFGGHWQRLAQQADKLAIVRSFAHTNSGHGGGTHYVMTGYDNRNIDNGGLPTRPSLGAIVAKCRGANHPETGMPTYVRMNSITADGPAFLGTAFAPFDPSGQARKNMSLALPADRLADRRELLSSLDRFQRDADQHGLMAGLDQFEQQAFQLITATAPKAFDIKEEPEAVQQRYGKEAIGQQLLAARRLVEAGCGFITLNYGGWDMHANLLRGMANRVPPLDQALAVFLEDLWERGLQERVLVVITGEFGRTPRVNGNGGRDHWAPLSTLALAGGGLSMGQVIGDSMPKADAPRTSPIRPADLMATVFEHLGIEPRTQVVNQAGRPVNLLEEGRPIAALGSARSA